MRELLTPEQRQTLKYRTGVVLIQILIAVCPDAALDDDVPGPDPAKLNLSRFQKLAIQRADRKAEDDRDRLAEQFNKAVEQDARVGNDWEWQEKLREAPFDGRRRVRAVLSPGQRERCDHFAIAWIKKAERHEATSRPSETPK